MKQPTSQAITAALEVLQWACRSEPRRRPATHYSLNALEEAIDVLDLHLETISAREAREHEERHERDLAACQEFRRGEAQ